MRIAIVSLDGIGDLLLRQPLSAALQSRGHEIVLVVRSELRDITRMVAPRARVVLLDADPYRGDVDCLRVEVARCVTRLRELALDTVVIAPFQRTYACERIALELRPTKIIGFSGEFYSEIPHVESDPEYRPDVVVEADVDLHELTKNERLLEAIVQSYEALPPPRLAVPSTAVESARRYLARTGVEPGSYWLSCIGAGSGMLKTRPAAQWAELLSAAAKSTDKALVFVGSDGDKPITAETRDLMQGVQVKTIDACGGSTDLLAGLASLAWGYIGRDGGPMQVSAAVGIPVVACFGGGHWPRFTPAASAGGVLTVGVPCNGCGWKCPFSRPYCITEIAAVSVLELLPNIEAGRFSTVTVPPSATTLSSLVSEATVGWRNDSLEAARKLHTANRETADRMVEASRARTDAAVAQRRCTNLSEINGQLEARAKARERETAAFLAHVEAACRAGSAGDEINRDVETGGKVSRLHRLWSAINGEWRLR